MTLDGSGEAPREQLSGDIADTIVRSLAPRRVFDAGCGQGLLVAALWDRGVEAHGRDVSAHAVARARPDVRGNCSAGPATDPIDGRYDLVVCIDVLEHLGTADADAAIERMTAASDRVLFSSAPWGRSGPAAPAARPPIYWLRRFAAHGFGPVLTHDATYVGPQAVLVERLASPVDEQLLAGAAELAGLRARLDELQGPGTRPVGPEGVGGSAERELERRFTGLARQLVSQRAEAEAAARELQRLRSTKTFRYSSLVRDVYARIRKAAGDASTQAASQGIRELPPDPSYELWVSQFDEVDEGRRRRLVERLGALPSRPLVTVIMPVYDAPETYLREAMDSVVAQIYDNWELCAVDDCSTAAWVPKVLEEYASRDPRIRVARRSVNGHISAASNTALEMARGEWVVLLDHDDVLRPHALALGVLAAARHPDAGLIYSDEDKILDDVRHRSLVYLKPDFDPLLLLAFNYICHMTMVRRDLAEDVGGFREGLEGSQDWDLVLRVSQRLQRTQVLHVPHVLYHWRWHAASTAFTRSAKPYATRAGARAVSEHLAAEGRAAEVIVNDRSGLVRVKWPLPDPPPQVSIIVPTRDGEHLERCLESLFARTDYPEREILVADRGSTSHRTRQLLEEYAGLTEVVPFDASLSASAVRNEAAARCAGEVLCFLTDDCEAVEDRWLEELVGQLLQERVGIVGAKTLSPDGRVMRPGLVLGLEGIAGYLDRFRDRLDLGHYAWLGTARTLSAVSGTCMVVRRAAFCELGGFDEGNVPATYYDVDLCLRAGDAGWHVVWTPHAPLLEHADPDMEGRAPLPFLHVRAEEAYMQERWGHLLRSDPAYNPNLTLEAPDFSMAFPPRAPWWAE